MKINEILKKKRKEIFRIAAEHGAINIRVFGSVARHQVKPSSDIDFLVEMEQDRSLLDFSGLWLDLEELLGCEVDLVESESLHWFIKDQVLKEAVPL